jgi:hypothetical protein
MLTRWFDQAQFLSNIGRVGTHRVSATCTLKTTLFSTASNIHHSQALLIFRNAGVNAFLDENEYAGHVVHNQKVD